MKKKAILIFSAFLLSIIVIVILLNVNKPFYLSDEYYNNAYLKDINSEELKELENDKKSFIVLVYDPFCGTSTDFSNTVREFSDINKVFVYNMLFADIKNTSIADYVKYCPSAVIYHSGKIIAYLDSSSNSDNIYYESISGFSEWVKKYILLN